MTSSTTNKAFQDAFEKFLTSLPTKEQARYSPCVSADDLLDGLGKLETLSKNRQKSRSRFLLGHVRAFSDQLQPYLDTIGTLTQGHPYACIAWGSLRLVLQLASNFSSFFEKLVELIKQLSEVFPQYGEIASLPSVCNSIRMRRHLEGVYGTLFQFFQSVAQIFTKPDGSNRRSASVACGLFWTPFDVRFKSILVQMGYYKDIIRDEIILAQALYTSNSEEAAIQERIVAEKERCHAENGRLKIEVLSGQTKRLVEADEKRARDEIFRHVQEWICPGQYAEIFQKSCDIREESTCQWIWDNPKFRDWRSEDWSLRTSITRKENMLNDNVLWIHGNPGSGKTILASSVIEDLQTSVLPSGAHPTVCYYFFSSDGPTYLDTGSPSSAYRAVLAQILQQHKNDTALMEKLAFSADNGTGQLHASTVELVDLLSLCSQHIEDIYLVLDGIDECDDTVALNKTLQVLTTFSPLKIALFSRFNVRCLKKTVVPMQQLPLDTSALSSDIECYLSRCLSTLMDEELLLSVELPSLVEHLVRGANGMFLWAKLMVNYLNSPALSPAKRLETIRHVILPEGLEKMYDRILLLVQQHGETEQTLARNIFAWLTYSKGPLTIRQLYEATQTNESNTSEVIASFQVSSFQETINIVCASLVECRASQHANRPMHEHTDVPSGQIPEDEYKVRFIHLSIKEHFTRFSARSSILNGSSLVPCSPGVHFDLTRRCLQSLLSKRSPEVTQSLSFATYSVLNWVDHLSDCTPTDHNPERQISKIPEDVVRKFCAILSDLLLNPKAITSWLSSHFSFDNSLSKGSIPIGGLMKWSNWSKNLKAGSEIAQELKSLSLPISELSADIQELIDTWGEKLSHNPGIIWDEATAFMTSRFLHNNNATKVTSLAPKAMLDPKRSSRPLCTISTTSADSTINAVLSVWPSKYYEDRWRTLRANDTISRVQDVCTDWIVRYELYNIQTKQSIGASRFSLDEGEVWLHMRQSLYERNLGEWSTSFPMIISKDVRCFVVLRTVFVFYAGTKITSQPTYQQAVLPTEFLDNYTRRWTDDLTAYDPMDNMARGRPLKWIHRDRYKYTIDLSPNGCYLSFLDSEFKSNLAVFEIWREATLRVGLVGSIQFEFFSRNVKRIFHSCADYIVLATEGGSYLGIQIWEFKKGKTVAITLDHIRYQPDLHSLSMSSCGNYLVVLENDVPSVIKLPEIYTHDAIPAKQSEPQEIGRQDLSTSESTEISQFSLRSGQSLNTVSLVNCRGGIASDVVTVTSGDEPTIHLTTGTGQFNQAVKVVSLPPSLEMTNTSATIILPGTRNEPLLVAVNMDSRHEYSMTGLPSRHLPVLIERDIQALSQVSTIAFKRDLAIRPARKTQYQSLTTAPAINQNATPTSTGRQGEHVSLSNTLHKKSLKRKRSHEDSLTAWETPRKR